MSITTTSTSTAGQSTATNTKTSTSPSSIEMTGADFMMLLLTQLRHQNPLEPMKDNEFMTQLTQLSSLSELQSISIATKSLSENSQMSNAASLIGKRVHLSSGEDGLVSGIIFENKQVLLQIGTKRVPLTDVVSVNSQNDTEVA
jgi:flagellar basal-body rod modification protein FlgD